MAGRLLLFILFSSTITVQGQETWNLSKCIEFGVDKNVLLKQAEFNLRNSALTLKESKMQILPNLSASVSTGISIGRNIDPTTNTFITEDIIGGNYSLSTGVVLFNSGALRNNIKLNQTLLLVNTKEYEQALNDYSLQVAANYLNVLLAEERFTIAKKNLEIATLQANQLRKLVEIGSRAAADALEMESAEARAQQTLTLAENALIQSSMTLKQVLRYNLNTELKLEKISEAELRNIINESYSSVDLYNIAVANQPGIQSAELRLKANDYQIKIARAQYFPTLSGFGNIASRYSDAAVIPTEFGTRTETINAKVNGTPLLIELEQPTIIKTEIIPFGKQFDQFLGYNFGIGLNVPIFNNYSTTANVKRAEIQKEQATLDVDTRKQNLNFDIIQAVSNVKLAIKELEAAQKSTDLSKLVYDNTTKKYNIGSSNNFELTTARTNFENAEVSLLISKYDLLFKQKVLDLYAGKKLK
ncbi:MAG: TolC family protein [Saprospiraceae bacterium]|nr:TolC family protein [Saprospiraceae bacterium]